jgi:hypothetical protein
MQENTDSEKDEEKGGVDYKAHVEKYDLKQAAHPRACIFTFLFKAAAILRFRKKTKKQRKFIHLY